jgi:hypothetical protein
VIAQLSVDAVSSASTESAPIWNTWERGTRGPGTVTWTSADRDTCTSVVVTAVTMTVAFPAVV